VGTNPHDSTWRDGSEPAEQAPNIPPRQQDQYTHPVPPYGYGQAAAPAYGQPLPPQPGYVYPSPPPYNYPTPMGFAPSASSTNGLGVAGFVTGLCGLVLFWVPVLGVILAAVGVVLSAVGLSQLKKTGGPTGLAVAGLALGILGVLAFVGLIVMVAAG
jgi:hypothetical protein